MEKLPDQSEISRDLDQWLAGKLRQLIADASARYQIAGHCELAASGRAMSMLFTLMAEVIASTEAPAGEPGEYLNLMVAQLRREQRKGKPS